MAKSSKRNKRTISPLEKNIIGSWVLNKEAAHAKAVGVDRYFEDGTKTGTVSMIVKGEEEMRQFNIKCAWKIRGKRITETLIELDEEMLEMAKTYPDHNHIKLGMKMSGTIVSIDDAEMKIHTDGNDTATTYYRHRIN